MRSILYGCITGVCLIGCVGNPQATSPSNDQTKNQTVKVYFQGEGPGREVIRFQKFLEIALDEVGMTRTDSTQDADITVSMDITHENTTEHLYAPVVWIAITSNAHQEYVLKSCNTVSTGTSVFDEPIKSVEPIRLPSAWEKAQFATCCIFKRAGSERGERSAPSGEAEPY